MKKLEIGCATMRYGYNCHMDSTTKSMNMTRMRRTNKCMRILREMIVHPRQLTQSEIKSKVYGRNIGKRCQGLFSALRHFDLANFVRAGNKCFWEPTIKGINFYMGLA